jgi:hypothetical protein
VDKASGYPQRAGRERGTVALRKSTPLLNISLSPGTLWDLFELIPYPMVNLFEQYTPETWEIISPESILIMSVGNI